MEIDRGSDKILAMEGASPPLGKGSLTEFHYTPTSGKSSISFKATFDSDYTAEFTGTANNRLGCEGCVYWWYSRDAHNFKVEGEYVVKDDSGNVADKGTFSLIGY